MPGSIKDRVVIAGRDCSKFGERWEAGTDDVLVSDRECDRNPSVKSGRANTKRRNATAISTNTSTAVQAPTSNGEAAQDSEGGSESSKDDDGGGDDDPSESGELCISLHIVFPKRTVRSIFRETLIRELAKLPWAILLTVIATLLLYYLGLR